MAGRGPKRMRLRPLDEAVVSGARPGGDAASAVATAHVKIPRFGALEIAASEDGITRLVFLDREPGRPRAVSRGQRAQAGHLRAARRQLLEYFRGRRKTFQLDLDLRGSDFDCEVWDLLLGIAYGKTRTYGQLARELGGLELARAVGGACGRNPVSIIVP